MRNSWKSDLIKIGNNFQRMVGRKMALPIPSDEPRIARHINKRQFLFGVINLIEKFR
uniref:Uncharacterized protein n=1 Tax=Candidatus Kentrum sp. SD TaxID=2126332 RepID=A0A450YGH3_9GAMM|nr:MAG: hypothetical protein BECKSD772F_GA0070984_100627 [Candidatus Kentron sp. SD]VFK40650.1 MAG: hypothetical protein BECKSD772E_GA0070983_100818 [Candidatus Kentron sp. SD]VFK78011.1 MAG: hypothetical protein BECKSD772D_GA0070982_100514 [Candidatus Kentron sp. SD]